MVTTVILVINCYLAIVIMVIMVIQVSYYLTETSFMVIMVILVIDYYLAIKAWLSWLLNYPTEMSMLRRGNVVIMFYLVFD